MRHILSKWLFATALLATSTFASAEVFYAYATVITDGEDMFYHITSNNAENFVKQFDDIKNGAHWDNNTSYLIGSVSFRGMKYHVHTYVDTVLGVRYLEFGYNGETITLRQRVTPTAGINEDPSDLNIPTTDVWTQLIDYLKGENIAGSTDGNEDPAKILNAWSDAWVAQTSLDPVAGNPNSFLAQLTNNDFQITNNLVLIGDTSGMDSFSLMPSYYSNSLPTEGFDEAGNPTSGTVNVTQFELPLTYTHYFNQNNALTIDMPISYQTVDTATTYSIALGLAYTHVILRTQNQLAWALTPSFHAGAVGSIDLGSGTIVYDGALASRVVMPINNWVYGLTNDVSYLKTAKIKIGDIETPYDLNNWVTENGIDATYSVTNSLNLGGYYNRFDVFNGQAWYIPNYNEVGIKFAKESTYKTAKYDFLTAAVGYQFGAQDYKGINVTLGIDF